MISGPVLPKTHAGLGELIECHLESVESGLRLLQRDLEFDSGWSVEALAHDAARRPVFLFTVDEGTAVELPTRLLAVRAWIATAGPLLARFLPADGVDYDLEPRLVVLGFEIPQSLTRALSDLRGPVEVYQVRSVRIAGETRVGAIPLLGAGVIGSEDSLCPPSGVRDSARTMSVRFLEVVERLDPSMRVLGDRYSRRFWVGGRLLAELYLRGGALQVNVPERYVGALRSRSDCDAALDHVMRRFLEIQSVDGAADAPAVGVEDRREMPSVDRSVSLERLREVVDSSQLSSEEYSVLGDSGSDD